MIKDLTGQRFGRLTVTCFHGKESYGGDNHYIWECKCDCGETAFVDGRSLRHGNTRSCGCLRKESCKVNSKKSADKNRKYVKYNGEIHSIYDWSKITGIPITTIRKRLNDNHTMEEVFSKEPLPRGGVRSRPREKMKKIVVNGEELTLVEASEKFGIPYSRIYGRLKLGYPMEKVISKETLDNRRNNHYNK